MKAFVTGGTGAVGREFLPKLLNEGWEVAALTRDPAKPGLSQHERLTYLAGDLDSQETIARLFATSARYDVVFHLAASLDYFGKIEKLMLTNAGGTANMVRFAKHVGARRFVYASSVEAAGAFALADVPVPVAKNNPPVSAYGASKVVAEKHVLTLVNEGISAICLRLGNVYGPGWNNFIIEYARDLLNRGRLWEYLPLFGCRYISPVHNDDVAAGLLASVTCSYSGIVNLVGQAATAEEIFRCCADAMGVRFTCGRKKPLDWLFVNFLTHIARRFDSVGYMMAPMWPRIHRGFSMGESSRLLDWSPHWCLRDGIRQTLTWAKDHKLLSF